MLLPLRIGTTMRVVITGASGKLGNYLLRAAASRGFEAVIAWSRSQPAQLGSLTWNSFDLTDWSRLDAELERARPDVILHTAALSAVNECLEHPDRADLVNRRLVGHLAAWCADRGARLITTSTDMVFDGERAPYDERSTPAPLSRYGASKRDGEEAALVHPSSLVVRLPLMVGPAIGPNRSFYDFLVDSFRKGEPVKLFADEWRAMLTYGDAADALLQLARVPASGVVHVAGTRMSRLSLGRHVARALGRDEDLAVRGRRADNPAPEPRARDLTLTSGRLAELLPNWRPLNLRRQIPRLILA
jgi:dTDP-4-dehydrorhamnose reductase